MKDLRPARLTAAVDKLAPAKGTPRVSRRPLSGLRARLLEVSLEELIAYRLNPRAVAALPYLASDTDGELRTRVTALAAKQIDSFTWPQLAQMLAFLYDDADFCRVAKKRLVQQPARPRWLRWTRGLGTEKLVTDIARGGLGRQPVLARLLKTLELSPLSPLGVAVLGKAAQKVPLESQPYTETLRFIERSSAAFEPRFQLLRRILEQYFPEEVVVAPESPQAELLALAVHCCRGEPNESSMWRHLPAKVQLGLTK
jgi:hypothetical protein